MTFPMRVGAVMPVPSSDRTPRYGLEVQTPDALPDEYAGAVGAGVQFNFVSVLPKLWLS